MDKNKNNRAHYIDAACHLVEAIKEAEKLGSGKGAAKKKKVLLQFKNMMEDLGSPEDSVFRDEDFLSKLIDAVCLFLKYKEHLGDVFSIISALVLKGK